jgi:hypothetical protein
MKARSSITKMLWVNEDQLAELIEDPKARCLHITSKDAFCFWQTGRNVRHDMERTYRKIEIVVSNLTAGCDVIIS